MDAASLDSLGALDRRRLYLFVAGPGEGEGLAIALPGAGWVLVDGCRTRGELPLLHIVERWRTGDADPVVAMVLTHPHRDHSEGFAELIGRLQPSFIAVTGSPPGTALLDSLESLGAGLPKDVTSQRLPARSVLLAVKAIRRWYDEHPQGLLGVLDEAQIPTGRSPTRLLVRAPDASGYAEFLAEPGGGSRLVRDANHLSLVLELLFGQTRVVLGGDLPWLHSNGQTLVPTGWESVLARHAHLSQHVGLKVPHHGSAEALHPLLLQATDSARRAWCVTPFNRSALPRREALQRLLQFEPAVYLTRLPPSEGLPVQGIFRGTIQLSTMRPRTQSEPTGDPFLDTGTDLRPRVSPGALDAVWCIELDDQGKVTGRFRGAMALEIIY